jgi:hypothetical protein
MRLLVALSVLIPAAAQAVPAPALEKQQPAAAPTAPAAETTAVKRVCRTVEVVGTSIPRRICSVKIVNKAPEAPKDQR